MTDILLDNGGDIAVTGGADIRAEYSIRQSVKILLKWFFAEWRFAPRLGMPYFEDVFIKNPNTARIAQIIRAEAAKAQGVKDVKNVSVTVDSKTRGALIKFTIVTDYGDFLEEVNIVV